MQEKVARMLLGRGADFKLVDRVSWTLLHFTVGHSLATVVDWISMLQIDWGSDRSGLNGSMSDQRHNFDDV